MIPDAVRGLVTRQGSNQLSELANKVLPNEFIHQYDREGTVEDYIMVFTGTTPKVRIFSRDGREHNIIDSLPPMSTYLQDSSPKDNFFAHTIGDTTFVINKTVEAKASGVLTPTQQSTGIIYCRIADYSKTYKVTLDTVEIANYTTPDIDAVGAAAAIGTGAVTTELHTQCTTNLPAGYTISTVSNNTFWITKNDGTDFVLETADDADGENLVSIMGQVDGVDKLPERAPVDYLVLVAPNGVGEDLASFWLVSVAKQDGLVYWKETTAPEISEGLDEYTMPVQVVRISIDGSDIATFQLYQSAWGKREVGNEDTNPLPDFVGKTLSCIGLYQNRLVIGAGESLNFSRSGSFLNFFKETGQKTLDGDPVSVYSDTEEVVSIKYVLPFDGDLIAFSNNSQFVMKGDEPLSPSNAVLRKFTDFEADVSVSPVPSGETIFFPFKHGEFSGVREFFTDSIIDTKRARPITDHVKQYVPTNLRWMVSSPSFSTLFVNSINEPNVVYTYDWLWQGENRVQAAWSKWVFSTNDLIEGAFIDDSSIFFVITRGDSTYVDEVDLGTLNDAVGYPVTLDRKNTLTFTKVGNRWEATDHIPEVAEEDIAGSKTTNCYPEDIGTDTFIERDGALLFTTEDLGAGATADVIVGERYKAQYIPTNPFPTDREGNAMGDLDKLTVSAFYFSYDTSGRVVGIVTSSTGKVTSRESSPRTVGVNNTVGFSQDESGVHRFPVRQRADKFELELESDDIKPIQIRSLEYDGNYNRRGRRI
jgi:hypothetical protein